MILSRKVDNLEFRCQRTLYKVLQSLRQSLELHFQRDLFSTYLCTPHQCQYQSRPKLSHMQACYELERRTFDPLGVFHLRFHVLLALVLLLVLVLVRLEDFQQVNLQIQILKSPHQNFEASGYGISRGCCCFLV